MFIFHLSHTCTLYVNEQLIAGHVEVGMVMIIVACCRDVQNALLDDYVLEKGVEWNIKAKTLYSVSFKELCSACNEQ